MFDSSDLRNRIRAAVLCFSLVLVASCGGGGGGGGAPPGDPPPPAPPPPPGSARNVVISWSANHEAAVNRAGGGYRVYYGTTPGFALPSGTLVDVPYVSGPTSPVTTTVTLPPGTYYVKVVAYSTLNTTGSGPSAEIQVVVP